MFETEAGFAETKMLINCNGDYSKKQDYKKGWQDGAEFGYNKANEWHYVKDGEYPKECDCCLLYLGSRFNCITGWRLRGVWYFEDNRDLEMWQDEVIAWKEIVLPKELENV